MNHYETVFILNPVLSDVQVKETVSKFEDFLTSRAEMVSKEDWGLKKWLTKSKQKSGFYTFEFKVQEKFLLLLKLNLDVTKDYAFLNCKFRQTRYFLG
jgi:small subunit ribosomal protein S6